MDVNTNGLSTGGYRGSSPYFGGGAAGSGSGGEEGGDQYYAPRPSTKHFGDSLVGVSLPRKANEKKKDQMDPEQALKYAKLVRLVSWGLSALAFFIFAIMFLQPILLPIFTFGAVFSGGFADWWEFTCAILKASVVPAAIGIALGWIGYFAHRKVAEMAGILESAAQKAPSLMERFGNGNRQPSYNSAK